MSVNRLEDIDIRGKRLLIREDLNVPLQGGSITSDARIKAAIPTLNYALQAGARIMVMSHLGRPVEGQPISEQSELSLAPIARYLSDVLDRDVPLIQDWLTGNGLYDQQLVLFENVRINSGEKANDETLAKTMAGLCDVFVMDAFGTAHRAQASTVGVARYAPRSCAGPLLSAELTALDKALSAPEKPVLAMVGGSKVSTKLEVLNTLSGKVDQLIVGGGIANTFLAAAGHPTGKSLMETDLLDMAAQLMAKTSIPLPVDVVVGKELDESAAATTKSIDDVADDEMILDIGPKTAALYADHIKAARTIIWNGPVGVFEFDQFASGSRRVAQAMAESSGFSLAGGGDTLAAIDKFGVTDRISYISTGGGAFLEFVEGKVLPAVAVLEERAD